MASIRELEGRVVASERVNTLGPPALLAVFREMRCRIKPSVDYPPALLFFFLLPPPHRHQVPLTAPHSSSVDFLPPLSVRPSVSGVLSQFTLVLMGTGPSAANPSSFDFPRPSNNSCKTFDAQQICIGEIASDETGSFVPLLAHGHCY